MMERKHLLSGLVTVMISCIAIMSLFPDSTIPNAIPVTLMVLCLVIIRIVVSHGKSDDGDGDRDRDREETGNDRPDSKPKF